MDNIFQRKIYNQILQWKQDNDGKSALLIEGARRVGKSTVVEAFAKREYKLVAVVLKKTPNLLQVFVSNFGALLILLLAILDDGGA